ncbi:MAG TPA: metallophosphoesterase [Candidatus Limnocylindrales bacterium]|nr:metallophosphoesterase [Candidatus Limnocylindrales bacterium]
MDRPSAARSAGLLVVAFVATLVLLAGGRALIGRGGAAPQRSPALSGLSPSAIAPGSIPPSVAPATVPPAVEPNASDAPTFVLLGAGDIANCSLDGAKQTSDLLLGQPGWIFTAGDNAYGNGSAEDYASCYAPTWGRVLGRTILPAAGNHDWNTPNAQGYRDYFGSRAAPQGTTWYSTTIGTWHIVVLDSDCNRVGGCDRDSAQGRWLAADLKASDARCTLAIWHQPRFSSGVHGDDPQVAPFWDLLFEHGAELVINGHDHDYERFGPQDPSGKADSPAGIRELVVGTGGADLRGFTHSTPNSEFRMQGTNGVLRLTLHQVNYDWEFLPTASDIAESGSTPCH